MESSDNVSVMRSAVCTVTAKAIKQTVAFPHALCHCQFTPVTLLGVITVIGMDCVGKMMQNRDTG